MCDPSISRIKNKNIITFGGYYERKNFRTYKIK